MEKNEVIKSITMPLHLKEKKLEQEIKFLREAKDFLRDLIEKNYNPFLKKFDYWDFNYSEKSRNLSGFLYVDYKTGLKRHYYLKTIRKVFNLESRFIKSGYDYDLYEGEKWVMINKKAVNFKISLKFETRG